MELELVRIARRAAYTIGRLYIDGRYVCDTLEDTDRGLRKTMQESEIRAVKIHGQTAIPTGRYPVTMTIQSPRFRLRPWARFCSGYLPRILGVPGFDGVLIHVGNGPQDTEGCILVGRNTVRGGLTGSEAAFRTVEDTLMRAEKTGGNIFMTVR